MTLRSNLTLIATNHFLNNWEFWIIVYKIKANARPQSQEQSILLKVVLIIWYIGIYFLIFSTTIGLGAIFWMTLLLTTVSLWFGPISLIGAWETRKLYDPATIFNSAIFYYAIKGLNLSLRFLFGLMGNRWMRGRFHHYQISPVPGNSSKRSICCNERIRFNVDSPYNRLYSQA